MKNILLIIIVFISVSLNAQIPQFKHNAATNDSIDSKILSWDISKYDFVIAYHGSSYWSRLNLKLYALALRKNKWYLISIKEKYKQIDYSVDYSYPVYKLNFIKKIPSRKIKTLIKVFNKNRIWNFDNDSLRITSRNTENGVQWINVTDGPLYTLDLITKDRYRIISAYYPMYYLKELPEITIRQNFINCQKAFEKIINKYK